MNAGVGPFIRCWFWNVCGGGLDGGFQIDVGGGGRGGGRGLDEAEESSCDPFEGEECEDKDEGEGGVPEWVGVWC